MEFTFLKILPLYFLLNQATCLVDDSSYEPVDDICNKCICNVFDEKTIPGYSILDCSTKGLRHILSGWPDVFVTNHTAKEIVFVMSGNDIKHLQQLPETNTTFFFTCRHCNLFEIASAAFVDAPNIIKLDLSWNKLTGDVLKADIFRGRFDNVRYDPIALENLDLSYNQISSLDSKLFEHTPNLRRFSIANNPLKEIDEDTSFAIASVKRMEHLDLSYTGISKLPDNLFKDMNNLRELLLQGNFFKTVPETLGKTLYSLYLGDNHIAELNDESFLGLNQLTHLNISGMSELTAIKEGTFSELTKLQVLICRSNKNLQEFDITSLKDATDLRELDISDNSLKDLGVGTLTDIDENLQNEDGIPVEAVEFPKLRSLKLEGNPWHCNCHLYASMLLLKHHGVDDFQSDDEPRCATPYEYAAALFSDLKKASVCSTYKRRQPKIPIYEPPPFLRPRNIVLSVLAVTAVVGIGLVIGFGIVCIKKQLRKNDPRFNSPIRYTTVRNSTSSTHPLQSV